MANIGAIKSCQASRAGLRLFSSLTVIATGNRNHLVVENSTKLGDSVNWATHHLYAVQHKDSEPKSAYPYNGFDPNAAVIDFNKFFDGDSLDQEDIVLSVEFPSTTYQSSEVLILKPQVLQPWHAPHPRYVRPTKHSLHSRSPPFRIPEKFQQGDTAR